MRLADYRIKDGYEMDGCLYEDIESMIQVGMLGFCGGGCLEANLEYILHGLELIRDSLMECSIGHSQDFWDRVIKHFGNDNSFYFFCYWATKEGFAHHGVGVPGWLTDKGKGLLAILRECKENLSCP